MTPKEVLFSRGACYKSGSYSEVYALYSTESEFRIYFTECSQYMEHVENTHCHEAEFMEMSIIEERIRGNIAEVIHIERFMEGSKEKCEVRYYTRTFLKMEDDCWKIFKEIREKAV